MVSLEQFKDKVRPDIKSHLDDQRVEELEIPGSGNRKNISRNMDDRKTQGKSTVELPRISCKKKLNPQG